MQYSILGNTGLAVSRLSLGVMTFGTADMVPGVKNRIDRGAAQEIVDLALDYGINLFDTADLYTGGQSERILGQCLQHKRQHVLVASKCGFRGGEAINHRGLSYSHIMSSLEGSLDRLGTDYLDIYFLHIPDPYTPLEESLRALDDARRKGMIRYGGISNYPAWMAQRMLSIQERLSYAPLQTAQMYYSLLGRDIEQEVIPFLQSSGLGLMVWSPLAGGYLSGKYTGENKSAGRRDQFAFPPIDTALGDKLVERLREIGERYGTGAAEVALAWLLHKKAVSTIVLGVNSLAHLRSNARAIDLTLSEAEIAELDDMSSPSPTYPGYMLAMGRDPQFDDAY